MIMKEKLILFLYLSVAFILPFGASDRSSTQIFYISGLNILSYQLVFSDGLSYISIFIKPILRGQKPKIGQINLGVNNICARYQGGYQIMAVGSVPLITCNNFSESIEF